MGGSRSVDPGYTRSVMNRQFRPPVPGTVVTCLGRSYIIREHLGQGSFGTVYACDDDWGNSLVAKILLPNESYEKVRDAWHREIDNLVRLRHPNITHIYDAFEFEDTFYLIIERCAFTLMDLFQYPGRDRAAWLIPIARCVLQALGFMHGQGYVYKDLHAGNVFTSRVRDEVEPGRVPVTVFKIGDLGISRLAHEISVFNTILAPWMQPPEHLDPHRFGLIGPTVDIYHAGLLFLGLLCPEMPSFSHEQIMAGAPQALAASLPSPFAPVIAAALTPTVAYRTPTALALWRDLARAAKNG